MSRFSPRHLRGALLAAAVMVFCLLVPGTSRAQEWGVGQTVARISYLSGDVSYSRGDDPDNWQAPARNVPVTLGDRLYAGDNGRAELEIQGGQIVRMAPRTDLSAL